LQTVPSVHVVPSGAEVWRQPVSASHESVVHELLSLQLGGVPGTHVPAWQTSRPLQTLPSPHEVPFAAAVWRQPPTGSHESAVHVFESAQFRVVPGWQIPPWQTSMPSQMSPLLHEAPFDTGVW